MVIVLMGVAGSGKTTVGLALAESLNWQFVDADNFHSPANVAKMQAGIPLNDSDRTPWLASLHGTIEDWSRKNISVVLACSALKESYRKQLLVSPAIKLVYLRGDTGLISQRLSERHGHYMNPALLSSQFATLEEPTDALVLDVHAPVPEIVSQIRTFLNV